MGFKEDKYIRRRELIMTSTKIKILLKIAMGLLFFPIITLFLWAGADRWPWPRLMPLSYSFKNFSYVITNNNFFIVIFKSIYISMVVTIITTIISILGAKAIGVYDFKMKNFVKILILLPFIVPIVSVAMGIHVTFIKVGLANSVIGIILVQLIVTLPYSLKIMISAFEEIKDKYEIQAKILGANEFQCFRYITLPLIMPAIITSSSLVFIISFSEYFLNVLIGGGRIITYSMVMFPFIQSGNRPISSAFSIIFLLITICVLGVLDKGTKYYYKRKI